MKLLVSDRLSSVYLLERTMESKRKGILFASGLVFLSFAFFKFLPAGPWLDASFSRGISGLLGLTLIYLSWYEHVFGVFGVVPSVERWKNPQLTWKIVVGVGFGFIGLSWISGKTSIKETLPEPSGMLLLLIGLLVTYTGLYAYLVTDGPLREES
tara:strand:- start:253 stop:717 length:465 start_codon:yes stop_codon:yes gene_type:complete